MSHVAWRGALQVRVMGSFDGWTLGMELSASDIETENVFNTFEGDLSLVPGTYRIKFLVDGEWRLARDWPTEQDDIGETVNVIVVS